MSASTSHSKLQYWFSRCFCCPDLWRVIYCSTRVEVRSPFSELGQTFLVFSESATSFYVLCNFSLVVSGSASSKHTDLVVYPYMPPIPGFRFAINVGDKSPLLTIESSPAGPAPRGRCTPRRQFLHSGHRGVLTFKQRIRLTTTSGVLLLKARISHDAYLSSHREALARFFGTRKSFMDGLPHNLMSTVHAPSWKKINDMYNNLLSVHREPRKSNRVASVIIEIRVEKRFFLKT